MKEIKPSYIIFEQAEWLKEKEFNVPTLTYWSKRDGLIDNGIKLDNYNNRGEWTTSRPEQWQVVEWLRINHNIDLYVRKVRAMDNSTGYMWVIFEGDSLPISKKLDSLQEAYSAAFDYIKNNNLI